MSISSLRVLADDRLLVVREHAIRLVTDDGAVRSVVKTLNTPAASTASLPQPLPAQFQTVVHEQAIGRDVYESTVESQRLLKGGGAH